MALVLPGEEFIRLADMQGLIAAVEAAALAIAADTAIVPKRLHIERDGNAYLTMPALGGDLLGTKLVSVIPGNAAAGRAVTSGIYVLCDARTGATLALLDAAMLTALRTGAVGSLGVSYMTPSTATSVGIIGCGMQGAWQAIAACSVRPIREVFYTDRSSASMERFKATVSKHVPGVLVTACRDAQAILTATEVIVTATTSLEPVLPDEPDLLKGKHFVSIGSFRPTMQELPDSVYRLAGELAVDCDHAREEVGDVINPLRKDILKSADVYPIVELIIGKRRANLKRTTVYKSVGMAIFDLHVAELLYEAAQRKGIGREVAI